MVAFEKRVSECVYSTHNYATRAAVVAGVERERAIEPLLGVVGCDIAARR